MLVVAKSVSAILGPADTTRGLAARTRQHEKLKLASLSFGGGGD